MRHRRLALPTAALLAGLLALTPRPAHALTPAQGAGHRHALLIGISDYHVVHAAGPFPDLDCATDVKEIEAALVHTFRFDPDPAAGQVVTLTTPAQTRRAAILAAFQHLVDVTQPGDIVYVHYSGHGDQVRDPHEPTGLDSAIVPCDYQIPAPADKTEATSGEIAGRTILGFIHQLQAKHPAQIVFVFDSCHSASAARGIQPANVKTRGLSMSEYADWCRLHPAAVSRGPRMLVRAGGGGAVVPAPVADADPAAPGGPGQTDLSGAGYVVISACRNTDCALETDSYPPMGRLSACLARVLTQATPQTTYRQVFDQVYAQFHQKYPDQYPQLDGSDPDAPLLGGDAVPPPASIRVLVDAGNHVTLDAGSLQGMTVGSEFAVFAPGDTTLTPGAQIADAVISAVTPTSATLTLTRKNAGVGPQSLLAAHAVETAHDYDTPPLHLDAAALRALLPAAQADAVLARLTDRTTGLGMVTTAPPPAGTPYDVTVARVPQPGARGAAPLDLVRVASGTPIAPLDPSQSDLPGQVYTALQREARYRYACGLGTGQGGLNPAYRLNVRVVPTDAAGNPLPAATQPAGAVGSGRPVIPVDGHFIIQVQNLSRRPLHVAILNLNGDGSIDEQWPAPGTTAQDNIIAPTAPGAWRTLWVDSGVGTTVPAVYQATSADPDEILKAIGTLAATREGGEDEYVDFTPLVTRGASRGPDSPFSDLFGPAVDAGTRGMTMTTPVPAGTWTAATLPFAVR